MHIINYESTKAEPLIISPLESNDQNFEAALESYQADQVISETESINTDHTFTSVIHMDNTSEQSK